MQLKYVVDPFGEVNVRPAGPGKVRVSATILMAPHKEGSQTGIAIDGSGSMAALFGMKTGGALSPVFARTAPQNVVSPVAQSLCAYLARNLDADGGTTCIYWATGPGGSQVEVVGDFTAEQAEKHVFGPPRHFGTGTQLLPAVQYFVERFADAPWGFYVFITDGELHDLEEVISYSTRLAKAIAAGKRKPLKFVLIGIGKDVNEKQMETLDDLDTGTDIDLWDHKLASEMRVLEQIFSEVVETNARVAEKGRILTPDGKVVKEYGDTGVPAFLEFVMPADADYFTLEVPGHRIYQALKEDAIIPAPEDFTEEKLSAPSIAAVPKAKDAPEEKPSAKEGESEEQPWMDFELKFDNPPDLEKR